MVNSPINEPTLNHSAAQQTLPERLWASLPANDPRFSELRAMLALLPRRGAQSPAPRMLGEYALLGFLLTTGRIVLAGESNVAVIETARQTFGQLQAVQQHVASALSGIDFE